MGRVLDQLACEVGVNERTLRRAVNGGLIRARRPSARHLLLSDSETAWVRSHWQLVSRLLAALRTEPNLKLVVLFGSVARGDEVKGVSDVDLLVEFRRPFPGAIEALRLRLNLQLPAEMQLVPLEGARRNPRLLTEVLRDGRPLVDREQSWSRLQARATDAQAQADQMGDELRVGAQVALGYFQRLAAVRAQSPLGT